MPLNVPEPKISVVIPTCNRTGFLAEAIRSALDQTVDILEVIVIDDASDTDPCPALAHFGDRVRCARLDSRVGASRARNRGVELARGNIVAFLDDDDLWRPEKTELQLAAMGDWAEACLCSAQELGRPPHRPWHVPMTEDRLRAHSPCGTSGLIATRAVMLAEPFDPDILRGEDWDVYVRIARRGTLAHIERPLYFRRTGHARITTEAIRQSPEELLQAAAVAHKHRAWLGERAFRRRIANTLLMFIARRQGRLRYVMASLRHAGLRATVSELAGKFRR
ncbi:glycosyltransferase family 2 protein [Oceaniglobus indicus]|uniref:glycosyltransferase family 2 protein n=1 Tax=Oceaniglobus indicus TaxID=2047749 RepID=UPI001F4D491C|nr:glycosyltransferase family 2 protein [Oceaniglobus indicus]